MHFAHILWFFRKVEKGKTLEKITIRIGPLGAPSLSVCLNFDDWVGTAQLIDVIAHIITINWKELLVRQLDSTIE